MLVDNYVESKMISCVTSDNLLGMGMVVSHLIQLGHKRIGFINGEQLSHTSRERFAGYLNAITLGGLTYDPQLVINGDFSEHSGGVCAEKLLEKKVNLQLWVKVKKDWRDSDFLIKNFGYDKKEI